MKNKIIMLFISIFSIFFLFSSNVLAEIIPINVPQPIQDMTETDFNSLKTLMSDNNISDYVIFYYWNDMRGIITDRIVYMNPISISCNNSSGYTIDFVNGTAYNISSDYSSLSVKRTYTSWQVGGGIYPTFAFVIYSTSDLLFSEVCPSSYPIIYENNTYSMPTSLDLKFYIIYDIYESIHGDPMPLLTNFFTIVSDKLNLMCQFFTSNYIYLSIFVIFIFYFVILLIRRFI